MRDGFKTFEVFLNTDFTNFHRFSLISVLKIELVLVLELEFEF